MIKDWYDGWIEEAEEMKIKIVSDTHWNEKDGSPMRTHCLRPSDYTKTSIKRWQTTVQPTDFVWHLGDVINGPKREVKAILADLPGRKGLVRGNHDRDKSCGWRTASTSPWIILFFATSFLLMSLRTRS